MDEAGMRSPPALPPSAPAPSPVQPARRLVGGFLLDLLIAVLVFLAVLMVGGVGIGMLGMLVAPEQGVDGFLASQAGLSLILLATAIGVVVAAVVPYLWRRRATRAEVAAANAALRRPATWAWIAGIAALLQGGSWLLGWLDAQQDLGLEPSNVQPIMDTLQAYPAATLVYVVLLGPVFEELLFRRVLFGRFLAGGRPLLGYALTAAVFASFHEFAGLSQGGWLQTAVLWTFYFAMGVALAWVYRRTGSLWAPILVHVANNAIAMGWMSAAI